METYAIFGDVYGCIDELTLLHQHLNDGRRKMISVGDLVDRGPDSVGVVRFAQKHFDHVVKGNHDSKLHRRTASTIVTRIWIGSGPSSTLDADTTRR